MGCARCDLVVFALETGGRWDEEAVSFVRDLAAARAADVPLGLRFATTLAYERRWARWLSTASAVAFIRFLTLPKAAIGVPLSLLPPFYRTYSSLVWTGVRSALPSRS